MLTELKLATDDCTHDNSSYFFILIMTKQLIFFFKMGGFFPLCPFNMFHYDP